MAEVMHLSFSLGPVQGFVAQARRTRDLWAGSWLLSYLAECALAAAEKAGGTAVLPHREAAERGTVTSLTTAVGGVPNRFEVAFTGAQASARARSAGRAATEALERAWARIATAVFDAFVAPVMDRGQGSEAIWKRQIEGFWEVAWVIGSPDAATGTIAPLAAMRKQFRDHRVAPEGGTKCSLMPTLQELSGWYGPGSGDRQRAFWRELSEQSQKVGAHDLKEGERLCAVALVKRLFPRVVEPALGAEAAGMLQRVAWPSTAFLAAQPWLRRLDPEARQVQDYLQQARALGYQDSETEAARAVGVAWASIDGPVWFASAVARDEPGQEAGGSPSAGQDRRALVQDLAAALRQVYGRFGQPVAHYAVLLMDGDSLGAMARRWRDPARLGRCLRGFTGRVQGVIEAHGGQAVYAGGDDLLALLPAESVLDTALALRERYTAAFGQEGPEAQATISAAIVYVHWRYPLRQALARVHRLLDEVAKDRTGRDALAIGVISASALKAQWSAPWDVVVGAAGVAGGGAGLQRLADRFDAAPAADGERATFNASYLYTLRQRFGALLTDSRELPGSFATAPDAATEAAAGAQGEIRDLLHALAHAEYRRRLGREERRRRSPDATRKEIDALMALSRRWTRVPPADPGSRPTVECDPASFGFDGWRVARFLKQVSEGVVEDRDE